MTNGEYQRYMESDAWQMLSTDVLTRAGAICEMLGCTEAPVIAHHLTYDRLGHEDLADLVGICVDCNALLHDPRSRVLRVCVCAHSREWALAEPCACPICIYDREAKTAKLKLRRAMVQALNVRMLEKNEAAEGSKPASLKREWEDGDIGDMP